MPPLQTALISVAISWLIAGTAPGLAKPVSASSNPTQGSTTLRDRAEALWQEHQLSLILAGIAIGSYLGVLWINGSDSF